MSNLATTELLSNGLSNKNSFDFDDLINCANGKLFGPGNAQLPSPPMLMFDRITNIDNKGGAYGKGQLDAELDINPDLWFFKCHFQNDPVMPGCLGLDALWQLLGFYLGWTGASGRGRALGVGQVKLTGQVVPKAKLIKYHVDISRVVSRQVVLGVADGTMSVDGKSVYDIKNMKVGTFISTDDM